jgi:hypothetical protein
MDGPNCESPGGKKDCSGDFEIEVSEIMRKMGEKRLGYERRES